MRLRGFGYSQTAPSAQATVPTTARITEAPDQRAALLQLRDLVQPDVAHPLIREVALQAISVCSSRDDQCEVEAIFDLVKHGRPDVPGFERGYKYVADPNWTDLFTAPHKIVEMLRKGINGGDCDDHSGLICALLGSLGFETGLLAYGPPGTSGYTHVLPVVFLPKRPGAKSYMAGLDSTVRESSVGWLPPHTTDGKANVLLTRLQ